jgi:phage-related protein
MLLTKATGVIITSFRAASSLVGPAFGLVAKAAGYLGTVLQSAVRLIPNAFNFITSGISKLGGRLLSLMNPVTKVIGAFTAGYALGTMIYNMVSDFEWFNDITDSIFGRLELVVSAITGIPGQITKAWGNITDAIGDAASSVSNWFSSLFSKIGGFFGQFGNMITGMFPWVSKVAEYGKGVGDVIGDLYKLWSGKVEWIGTLFNGIKGKVADWFSWVPGIGNASNSSPVMAKSTPRTEISVTKSPAPSTIDSPSAVPASKRTSADSVAEGTNNTVMMDNNTGKVKPPVANDINTLLGYQTTILTQLLETTQTMVSVNRDILKYTKAN